MPSRIPVNMIDHPATIALSDNAFRLFLSGLCFCDRHATDGYIHQSALGEIVPATPSLIGKSVKQLVSLGFWQRHGEWFWTPFFLAWNPTRTRSRRPERSPRAFSTETTTRRRLIAEWGRACVYCGVTVDVLHVEHIIPLCRGGADAWDNLTVACQSCNFRKGRKTAAEFGFPQLAGSRAPRQKSRFPVLPERLPFGREPSLDVDSGSGGVYPPALSMLAGSLHTGRRITGRPSGWRHFYTDEEVLARRAAVLQGTSH